MEPTSWSRNGTPWSQKLGQNGFAVGSTFVFYQNPSTVRQAHQDLEGRLKFVRYRQAVIPYSLQGAVSLRQ